MKRFFPLPLYTFIKIASKSGGISFRGLKNLIPWIIKTVIFEPLRWIELLFNRKIKKHKIEKTPVFILGFYRSGTSFTHQLLTKDDRFGYHTNFQMVFPEIMLGSERFLAPFFNFICRLFNIQDPVHRKQLSFNDPGEEDAAMTTSLNPKGAQWGYFFPKIMKDHFDKYVLLDNISESEKEQWKKDFIFLQKKISIASKGKQLVLKSPPNTARVKILLSLYPDAKFVFIHRDPYEVFASNRRFLKVTKKIYALGKNPSVDNDSNILDTYSKTMQRYLSEKDLIPEGQLIEIPYTELVQNPLESVRKMYETLDLNDFSYVEDKLKSYVAGQKSFVQLKHELSEAENKMITEKFEPFIKHWNYPLQ
tara:strand:- start:1678 stop:2769 length:1092 start_codon:yes stop_codon:yes gene_type:complete